MRIRALTILPALALPMLAGPATARADVVFGSPLSDPPNAMPFRHGWDQNAFNIAGPVGVAAPAPGLVERVRVRGGSADGRPLQVKFRVIRPLGNGAFQAIATPMVATLPPNEGAIHSYRVPDPRAFRVQAGDLVALYQEGFGGAGRMWEVFSAQPGWTMQKVAIANGFNDNTASPLPPVDAMGNSTVSYAGTELLLQAVESQDRCPGTDLPQSPCRSRLYLGGRVTKGPGGFLYTWTVRNGGPHPAAGIGLQADFPARTTVVSVGAGCAAPAAAPVRVGCDVGSLPPPQVGGAFRRFTMLVVPPKDKRRFRVVGHIDAPGVVDPHGDAKHVKVVRTSTRLR
jgi:hypothetical protein